MSDDWLNPKDAPYLRPILMTGTLNGPTGKEAVEWTGYGKRFKTPDVFFPDERVSWAFTCTGWKEI